MEIIENHFLPEEFKISTWDKLEPFYQELNGREINSVEDLLTFLKDRSQLDSMVSEDLAWRYIRMTCDTSNPEFQEQFNFFINEIEPKTAPFSNDLNKKYFDSPFHKDLKGDEFNILYRNIEKDIKVYREENIPVFTALQTEQKEYGATVGAMMVNIDGQDITLPKASDYLQKTDRQVREVVYLKIQERRLQDKSKLDNLFNTLIKLRTKASKNAGFANFRDYMFVSMGRFDYSVQDCFDFHEAVQVSVVPLLNEFSLDRKKSLGLETLRPWDLAVDKLQKQPLKPFENGNDLLEKTIKCFDLMDPFLGDCLREMKELNRFDLESKKGKAPGGYNYPLYKTGYPFIFMNATSNFRDMITLLHEGGHAVHSILTKDLELVEFKGLPSEIAELASMSMELITMDHWDVYFDNKDDLNRAKKQHLESLIETLPWVAVIDKFQHWIYENPTHTIDQRTSKWIELYDSFSSSVIDWTGLEPMKANIWQKQLHLFEVPFYYIEYGIAQLGAIGVWRNYKKNAKQGLQSYLNALKLGSTATIPKVYETAGIPFNFTSTYINELMDFVRSEIKALN